MDDTGVPNQAPTTQEMQGGDETQAPSYSLNTNIGLNEPLGKDERMMMDTRNGTTTAIPMNMSDQEANFWIENQDKMGAMPPKSPEYNRIMGAIQTGGASEQVFQPWKQVTADFLKNGLQGLSMNVYKPSAAEEQFYQTFQKGTSQFDQTIGQLGAFLGVSKAVGAIGWLASLGLGAMGVGALPDAFTGLVAKFGLEGAQKIAGSAGAAANMEATGTIVGATSNIQSEIKDNEPVNAGKDIGEAAVSSIPWSLVMGAGAAIAKPFEGMSKLDATGEVFKRATFAGGTTYTLMRADNSSHEDSLLGATLMTGLALVHGGAELMDAEAHGKIGQAAIDAYARYVKQSNFAIPEANAYEIGKQVVTDTAKATLDENPQYQAWLEKNAQSETPENPNMSVPLHPAKEGKAGNAKLPEVVEQEKAKAEEQQMNDVDIARMEGEGQGGAIKENVVQAERQAKIDKELDLEKQRMDNEGGAMNPMNVITTDNGMMKDLMNKLTVQVVMGDEGEKTLNRGEVTPTEEIKQEGGENAESGGGSTQEGSAKETPEGETQTGVHIRDTSEGGVEAKAGEKVGNQEPIKSEGEQKKSRLFERVKADIDDNLKDNPLYNEMNMKEHAEKAIALQKSDPDLVKRVAQGLEPAPEGYSETALRSAHYQAMRDAGNEEEANRAITSDTLRGTRLGQEVNMYKMYGKDGSEKHTAETFIKKAIQDRVKTIGKGIKTKGTPNEKFFKEADKQKSQVKDIIKKSELTDDDINKVIDSIKCS